MRDEIILNGVRTNNLKNLDVKISFNKITAITGVSGGGKSSLAYDTLYELCKKEFLSIENGYHDAPDYVIDSYRNTIPSVGIKQKNTNINPRSTLYTYLNIPSYLSYLLTDKELRYNGNILKINKPENQCCNCHGLKIVNEINVSRIIDYSCTVKENPFIPWRSRDSDKKYNLLLEHCESNGIPIDMPFISLSDIHKDKLMYDDLGDVYPVSFKHMGKRRNRKLRYIGLLKEMELNLSSEKKSVFDSAAKFMNKSVCEHCFGTGLNFDVYKNVLIYGMPFFDFMSESIDTVYSRISNEASERPPILNLFEQIIKSGISYLSLIRSIPSLSGGELQKLNFSKLCNSEITGVLVVIDEISSQIHVSDYKMLFDRIRRINDKGNTVVLVEHNDYFIERSDNVLILGPRPGNAGGFILEEENKKNEHIVDVTQELGKFDYFHIEGITINNVHGLNLKIPIGAITTLVGKSGSGKSSIAKFIENEVSNVIYISQKLIKGNIRSTVASITGLNKKVSQIFSNKFKLDFNFFSINDTSPIICKDCLGKGVVKIKRSFESDVEALCQSCDGLLFSDEANQYLIEGLSIRDLYDLPISELAKFDVESLSTICEQAVSLGLGHLSLRRKTQTLSGGELKRIKLLTNLPSKNTKNKILLIDEPASGLDNATASNVIEFIKRFSNVYKAILLIDHKPVIFLASDYVIEIGPGSGINGGRVVFEGAPMRYYDSKYLSYLEE
ncbi:ATP-binding cassette domain-containing protein [Vibrio harveyi]|uniref:ATP-binding cassette domain-containing protein n=1 Tax=Vibrio harveyi TaxID=669 RepID=UPI0002C48850|nr:ATP-binding cassette domain-containing protein [Vibrio harveyi]EMR34065.1 ABC transporter [Vibrio harveyi CAIM 1792]